MTKEQLKDLVTSLQLDSEINTLLMGLIDGASDVNQTLLDAVSAVLDQQATFYEKAADILEKEEEQYDNLTEELDYLEKKEYQDKMEAINQNQENILNNINKKVEEMKTGKQQVQSSAPAPAPTVEETKLNDVKATLEQISQQPKT